MVPADIVTVIGGGLAGSEAAFQLARRGIKVRIKEMRGIKGTAAHKTDRLAELVCSNSLGSDKPQTAPGMLKNELRLLDSLIMEAAGETAVPAGGALAVDREKFACYVEERLRSNSLISIEREEVCKLPQDGITILATGPLTSDNLAAELRGLSGEDHLYFYDAISPIIDGESIDYSKAFPGARYEESSEDYINCPMTRQEYDEFYEALISAERVEIKEFEKYFEGCMPVEALADRGKKTLLFGPMKPVGLKDKDGQQPFAVCQLRHEDRSNTGFNMVGFQTRLKRSEQKRVFGMIPALKDAVYLRYGSIHRNTFINSPALLDETLRLKPAPHIFMAGQITGVEGYVESCAMGLLAGLNAYALLTGRSVKVPAHTTAIGSLVYYITNAPSANFQPMNINFGLIPPLERRERNKQLRRKMLADRGVEEIKRWKAESGIF